MKAGDYRELSVAELEQKLHETRNELFNAKIKHSTGQLEDTAKLGRLRRDVARMNTVLTEKREAKS